MHQYFSIIKDACLPSLNIIKTNLMLSSMPLGALVAKKENFIKLLQHYLYIIVNTTSCCAELNLGQTRQSGLCIQYIVPD